ncbi:AraC family transcriptional regulator, partial [Asaia sp. W19]
MTDNLRFSDMPDGAVMPHVAMVLTSHFQFLALGVQAAFELANTILGEEF